jgi:transposase-like protein
VEQGSELISLSELARRIGVDVDTVRKWRDREGLPVYALGAQRHAVLWTEYTAWLNARRVVPRGTDAIGHNR